MGELLSYRCDGCGETTTLFLGVGMMGHGNDYFYCDECGALGSRSYSFFEDEPPEPEPKCEQHPDRAMLPFDADEVLQARPSDLEGLDPEALAEALKSMSPQEFQWHLNGRSNPFGPTRLRCSSCREGWLALDATGCWD